MARCDHLRHGGSGVTPIWLLASLAFAVAFIEGGDHDHHHHAAAVKTSAPSPAPHPVITHTITRVVASHPLVSGWQFVVIAAIIAAVAAIALAVAGAVAINRVMHGRGGI